MCKSKISSESISQLLVEKNIKGGRFTIKSLASGKDYTYSVSRSEFKGNWYTHVKVETQYLEFKRIGSYFNGRITNKRQLVDTPSAKAIAFVLKAVEQKRFEFLDSKMETFHLGKCIRCGKTLTDATSIQRGLGDVCAKKF
tara:strand:+ start:43 stop:465 length:423 start_codon:yes stop_codon:yes gene_type:complete